MTPRSVSVRPSVIAAHEMFGTAHQMRAERHDEVRGMGCPNAHAVSATAK